MTYPETWPHRREDYITKMAPVEYRRDAMCPQFLNFLSETFGGSPSLVGYMTRVCGYFLTGLTHEQKWWMFYGPTASGKSTFVKVLHGILGPYAYALPENYFLLSRNEPTDFATANLPGVRLATCVETNEGKRLNVARIKAITGEDKINAQLKYQNHFQFQPQCKLVLVTNNPPKVPAGDDALWRRLNVVPFVHTVPEERREAGLAERLVREESSGILNWMIDGCREWQEKGLVEPEVIRRASGEYRSSQDIVNDFLTELYTKDESARESKKDVVREWKEYCEQEGIHPGSTKKLTQDLARCWEVTVSADRRSYLGLKRTEVV
jgi:putative DNA primase/helicase